MSKDLALAYAMSKKKKKMAHGGGVHQEIGTIKGSSKGMSVMGHGVRSGGSKEAIRNEAKEKLHELKSSPNPKLKGLAHGGVVEDRSKMSGKSGMVRVDTEANQNSKGVNRHGHHGSSGGTSEAGAYHRDGRSGYKQGPANAKELHKQTLEESRSMPAPKLKGLAEGGEIDDFGGSHYGQSSGRGPMHESIDEEMPEEHEIDNEAADEEDDVVSRAMESRKNMYSKGGMIANGGDDELDMLADSKPNEFDDLALRDDLEIKSTGENSGDHLGNEQLEQEMHDVVSRVMRSRAKKDRLPSPR